MTDVLGNALKDYQQDYHKHKLWIHNKYGRKEEMPVDTYFRTVDEMSDLELMALDLCKGNILDVGAGAGCHSLILQQRQRNVKAMDISEGAAEVMLQRGVNNVITANIFTYPPQKFDTLLFLMNGIGIAATLTGLHQLLLQLQQFLQPDGHILFDSSDVTYLYKDQLMPAHYYGEIDYQYAYRGKRSDWFKWLYADKQTMHRIATTCGFKMDVLMEDEFDQYLGRLTIK